MPLVEELQKELKIPELLSRILVSRGIKSVDDAQRFLFPRLEHLSDPHLLPDIERAVSKTISAIVEGKRICLFADYDADGIASCALLTEFLRKLGIVTSFYIPTRTEGYGLNEKALRRIKDEGTDLVIALDLGSTNHREIEIARKVGLEVIVIDHHEIDKEIPKAHAVVNPKRKDSSFPTRELAACGVTFFFLIALRRELAKKGLLKDEINLRRMMDFVALGTIADMVPLVKDNRILVKFGLESMKGRPRTWVRSLINKNVITQERIDENAISYIVAPRINAPGRISNPEISLRFLIEEEEEKSQTLLDELNEANRKRQSIEDEVLSEIFETLEKEGIDERRALIFHNETWHIGVLGIVAQKLVEAFGRPAFVFTTVDGILRGSARGVDGMDLFSLVSCLSGYLLKFGGHSHACGISLLKENLDRFSREVESILCQKIIERAPSDFDLEVDFDEFNMENILSLDLLSPFGIGNPRPKFLVRPVEVVESLSRLKVIDRKRRVWYGFFKGQEQDLKGNVAGLIVTPELRDELGEKFVYLLVKGVIREEKEGSKWTRTHLGS